MSSTEPAGMAMGRPTLDSLVAAAPLPLGSPLGVPSGSPPPHSTPSKNASMSPRQEVVCEALLTRRAPRSAGVSCSTTQAVAVG
eukprot:scaffold29896_cov48-Phaeocystis_antarctica.AAC.2